MCVCVGVMYDNNVLAIARSHSVSVQLSSSIIIISKDISSIPEVPEVSRVLKSNIKHTGIESEP